MINLSKFKKYKPENQNEWKVIRIVSNVEREGRLPTDCKFVLQSRIVKDNGKGYIYVNWPAVWSGCCPALHQLPCCQRQGTPPGI